MTVGWPPCTVATTELVVPRSMPMTSSPTVCLQRLQERLGLLVIGVLVEQRDQLGPRARLHAQGREDLRQEQARRAVARIQLHRARGPGAGGARVVALQAAAGRPERRGQVARVELEGRPVGGDGVLPALLLLALLARHQSRVGAGAGLLALQLHQLGGALLSVVGQLPPRLPPRELLP